jgi:hypothetical protein
MSAHDAPACDPSPVAPGHRRARWRRHPVPPRQIWCPTSRRRRRATPRCDPAGGEDADGWRRNGGQHPLGHQVRTNTDRKMASSDTTKVRKLNGNGSNGGRCVMMRVFATTHPTKKSTWTVANPALPVKRVIAVLTRSASDRCCRGLTLQRSNLLNIFVMQSHVNRRPAAIRQPSPNVSRLVSVNHCGVS